MKDHGQGFHAYMHAYMHKQAAVRLHEATGAAVQCAHPLNTRRLHCVTLALNNLNNLKLAGVRARTVQGGLAPARSDLVSTIGVPKVRTPS